MEIISILSSILGVLKSAPIEFTLGFSTFVAIVAIWLKSRDIDISAATSISNLQLNQIRELLNQNKELIIQNTSLASDLYELRIKMTEAHMIMESMREQLADAIDALRTYKRQQIASENNK